MVTETKSPEGNDNSNVPPSLIVFHHSELSKIEREEHDANEKLKAIRKRKSAYRKTITADGLKLKNFDMARTMLMADGEEARSDMAETGRILRAFRSPLGHQFDLFEEPDLEDLEARWKFDGFRAGSQGMGAELNPHRRGDSGFPHWEAGWLDAQKSIAAGMELSQSTPEAGAEVIPDQVDTEDAIEEAADEPDWREERDAAPVESEEDALAVT